MEEAVERIGRDHPEKPQHHKDPTRVHSVGYSFHRRGRCTRGRLWGRGGSPPGTRSAVRRVCAVVRESIAI
jgi:hypothetical protein